MSVGGIGLAGLCFCVGMFKVFRISPENVLPVVRISGLDHAQAWMARRQAKRHEREGRPALALLAWKSCIANHPYHEQNLTQAVLAHVRLDRPTRQHTQDVARYGRLMAEKNNTESSDHVLSPLTLVWMGGVTEAADLVISMGTPSSSSTLTVLSSILLLSDRSLPESWKIALRDVHDEGKPAAETLLKYSDALQCGDWGEVPEVRSLSVTAMDGGPIVNELLEMLEINLHFWLLSHRSSADEMRQKMEEHRLTGRQRTWHRLLYWRTQIESGNGHRVWSDIKGGGNLEWLNAAQVIEWGKLYQEFDKSGSFIAKLKPLLGAYASSPELTFYHGSLLIQDKRWVELRALATRMRARTSNSKWKGLSFFFEAQSWQGQRSPQAAKECYQKWVASTIYFPDLELEAARTARHEGMSDYALRRYRALEPCRKQDVSFWKEAFEFGRELQLERYQLDVSQKLHALEPQSKEHAFNYASLLLAIRRNPSLAIALTDSLILRFPHDQSSAVAHIHALLQNDRLKEAARGLSLIDPDQLPVSMRDSFQLAQFERLCLEGKVDDARFFAGLIQRENLFVHQHIWLEEQLYQLERR